MRRLCLIALVTAGITGGLAGPAAASEDFASWAVLKSTFPSTGGGGITIKGYDPVITDGKCITTFMAVPEGANPPVYTNVVEFEAVETQGGTLCTNGKWKSFDGSANGTTTFRVFFRDGVFRASPPRP
jgi:hypothetical protein